MFLLIFSKFSKGSVVGFLGVKRLTEGSGICLIPAILLIKLLVFTTKEIFCSQLLVKLTTHRHVDQSICQKQKYHVCVRVCSGYCMQEFDIAYHHNIMEKRKKRLIVLMALDSPNDLYANDASDTAVLRQYLRQYTYIDYAAEDWLDRLLYSMPLRGMDQAAGAGQPQYHQDTDMLLVDPMDDE